MSGAEIIDLADYCRARWGYGVSRDAALNHAVVTRPDCDLDLANYRAGRRGPREWREIERRFAEATNPDRDLVAFAKRGEPPGVWDRLHAEPPCDCEPKETA